MMALTLSSIAVVDKFLSRYYFHHSFIRDKMPFLVSSDKLARDTEENDEAIIPWHVNAISTLRR